MGKDKDKKRKYDSSSDSDSSDDDRRRKDKKEAKKKDKTHETREEKMRRRMQKRAMKRLKEEERKTICGYTDENNRFGDSQLTQAFTWHKKAQAEDDGGAAARKHEKSERMRRQEEAERKRRIEEEVEKVKRRREEREEEAAWLEEEKARASRQQEEEQHAEWEKKADDFHLKQAHERSKIRINEGRAKPIDMLAKNLISDDMDLEMSEPYKIFRGLSVPQLEELQTDIDFHQGYDQANGAFWDAMVVVCEDELQRARRRQAGGADEDEGGVHAAIYQDVVKQLKDKTLGELDEQEGQIQAMIESDAIADTEFWETVLKRLVVAKAKARLKEIHGAVVRRRIDAIESGEVKEVLAYAPPPRAPEAPEGAEPAEEEASLPEQLSDVEVDSDGEEERDLSPPLEPLPEGATAEDAVDPAEDLAALEEQRRRVLQEHAAKLAGQAGKSAARPSGELATSTARDATASAARATSARDDAFFAANQSKVSGGMGDDEAVFGGEVSLDQQVYAWHDKYRPRKPRFFNRVHTGFEWNKYNQTHYDHDNPPPKVVQGYKFNIFYPDLIDKTKAPTFVLEKDSSPETRILRFTAGPPYEDLAFRVVAKEWEFSHKRGFKCTFDRGILHLYFNFKRYRYRK